MTSKPEVLIEKLIRGQLSKEEAEDLEQLIAIPEYREYFKEELRLRLLVNAHYQKFEPTAAYERFEKMLQEEEAIPPRRLRLRKLWRYAAVLVVVLGIGYLISNLRTGEEQLYIPDESITLDLGNGTLKTIRPNGQQLVTNADGSTATLQRGDTLRYDQLQNGKIAYHTLSVPYGKTHKILLSDGTYVYLNAGSSLTYPNRFEGRERKVILTGEAYFEVTHQEGNSFIVNTRHIDVRVYGTKFNVSAYSDDPAVETTLMQGSVALQGNRIDQRFLVPGEMGRYRLDTHTLQVNPVNVRDQIAWIHGQVVFKQKPFGQILKVLERKYNVQIENTYPVLDHERYNAVFDTETIEEVLQTFTKSRLFDYEIENNTIILKKPAP